MEIEMLLKILNLNPKMLLKMFKMYAYYGDQNVNLRYSEYGDQMLMEMLVKVQAPDSLSVTLLIGSCQTHFINRPTNGKLPNSFDQSPTYRKSPTHFITCATDICQLPVMIVFKRPN